MNQQVLGWVVLLAMACTTCTFATPPDASGFDALLKSHVDKDGMVDYKALKKNRAALDTYTRGLAKVDPADYKTWSDNEKIALWLNAYNAYTLTAIIDAYPIKPRWKTRFTYPKNSIRQIAGVWDKTTWTVAGRKLTLDAMEHQELRKHWKEPRIHMALVCASIGCPRLRNESYSGKDLDTQLNDQLRDFFLRTQNFRFDAKKKRIYISKLFDWFAEDFGDMAAFVAPHVADDAAAALRAGDHKIVFLDYDWALNEQ